MRQILIQSNSKHTKQQGYTLVSVLIMSLMAGTVVLSSLQSSVIQERLTGNFQKKINARLLAEKGVFDTLDSMTTTLSANPTSTIQELVAALPTDAHGNITGQGHQLSDLAYAVNLSHAGSELTLTSKGSRFEGLSQLNAIFELQGSASSKTSPFADGIIGCEGVDISASGSIDSYNSALGDYHITTNKGKEAVVKTVTSSGLISLSGASTIEGDVFATHSLALKSGATIDGDVFANGNVTLPSSSDIHGNVTLRGNYKQSSGTVGGTIHANGTVTLNETKLGGNLKSRGIVNITGNKITGSILSQQDVTLTRVLTVGGGVQTHGKYTQIGGVVSNGVRAKGNVHLKESAQISNDDLRYNGIGTFYTHSLGYGVSPYAQEVPLNLPDVAEVVALPTDDSEATETTGSTCDVHSIEFEVLTVDASADNAKDLTISGSGTGDIYLLSDAIGDFSLNNGSQSSPSKIITPVTADFLGVNHKFLAYDNVTIKGHLKVAPGANVMMYVKGNFKMSGSSSLTIPDNSSLTLVIKGAVEIGGGAQVYTPAKGITTTGQPVFSIYSSYSGTGIDITGGTESIYAAIYAPKTDITISSDVAFKGSVLGNKVTVSGDGGLHYDTALSKAKVVGNPSGGSGQKLVFKGWKTI
ncbi:hypothetical protein [Psychrobium sp. 1_MG-2023]|uniref:DUF7305 domain-containing protein n=1 Tax=Psychrobium sp. 1_MG-2023 TaxID=3062624 RepID=UPI000C31E78F|nr:hypothetical protein [Psychrobium sp. 1_MG-2023]MDP2560264.1 hypothetical protein [Psychrobium sp. 1_MG-2023]PKF55381.1 hypothetical protein CW748_12820 [Alteromonadales bacterium alter-6D02]